MGVRSTFQLFPLYRRFAQTMYGWLSSTHRIFPFTCLAAFAVSVFAENAHAQNNPPVFDEGTSAVRSIPETFVDLPTYTETPIGDRVDAADPDSEPLTYSLEGADADKFTITPSSGQIKTKVGERYDYEADPSLEVTVKADDGRGGTSTIAVTINLINNTNESPGYMPTPTIEVTEATSLLVSWQTPPIAGRPEITGYDIQYRRRTSELWTSGPQGVTGTSTRITCLAPDTDYKVRVQAYNEDGASGWSGASNTRRTLTCPPLQTCPPSQCSSSTPQRSTPQASATPDFVPLTARFRDVPVDHDGSTAFTLQLAFNEPTRTTATEIQQALTVTGGTVTRAQQVNGSSKLWEITVTPNSNDDVRISLPPTTSCFTVGAVCSSDGRVLQRGVAVSILRAPLRAHFEHVPAGHYRTAPFALQLAFSEPIEMPKEKIQQALMVTGGRMKSVQPVNGSSDLWELTAIPDSNDDVSISLPPTTSCDADNAICTADGRMLLEGVAVSVAIMPLTARFEEVPAEHIGTLPFALRIAFSEPIGLTAPAMQQALTVTGDKTTSLLRVNGRSDLWEVEIQPNGDDVSISLSQTTSCNDEGAVCTQDGVALQNDAQAVIPFAGYAMPHSLDKVSGEDQEGAASTQLAEPFVVFASDEHGAAMAGARVTFTVTSGGGMLSAIADANPCIFKAAKASITAITAANGQATTRLTLGSQPETNTVAVSVEGLEATFTATATEPAMSHSLSKVCGDDQEGAVGQRLAKPLVVLVSDENGAAMTGVAVTFAVTAGEGTLSTTTDTTAANGRARTWLTLGSELGTNTVEATVEGLESATFTAAGQASPLASFLDAFQNGRGKRVALPNSPQLAQNAPNPFNSQTALAYFLPAAGPVRLEMFSLTGQRVAILRHGLQQAGFHRLRWDGRDDAGRSVASGLYLYRLVTDEVVLTRKLILLR